MTERSHKYSNSYESVSQIAYTILRYATNISNVSQTSVRVRNGGLSGRRHGSRVTVLCSLLIDSDRSKGMESSERR